jgi:uncharacterized protein YeaO (DUF488 family)
MLTLKRVYEPAAPEDGLRVLVERRWPPRLDKGSAAIDSWEKQVAPSAELHRWFGGRRSRWAAFRTRYALELRQHREKLACLRAAAAERPVTLLFSARDQIHNSAAVLRDVLCRGLELEVDTTTMSRAELLMFLNRLLAGSRATISEAKAILRGTAARMLDIQRDEAYASAVLIQLVKSLGGRPDYGIESTDATTGGTGLASRLTFFGQDQIRLTDALETNLRRIADDRVRHRLQKLLIARVRNIRRLEGRSQLALAKPEPDGRC